MAPPSPTRAVIAVSSNKGGVGKTTLAGNLAVYLRALDEDLPILVLGLDDQGSLDRMFAWGPPAAGEANLKHAWAERDLERAIRMGEYGVHYVPSPPDAVALKARAEDPHTLRRMLERLAWKGVVIVDTKSDLEALTRNALAAADRVLIPVPDWAALLEAGKVFAHLEAAGLGRERGRAVLSLVDSRTRVEGGETHLADLLRSEIRRRGWPCYLTALSRSPRVEALNSAGGRPRAILHHAQGTRIHKEFAELTRELLEDLGLAKDLPLERGFGGSRPRAVAPGPSLKRLLLRGLGG